MVTPEMGNRLPRHGYFAIDNGCYSKPHAFKWDKYQRYIDRLLTADGERCLFVAAPDAPFDADGTLARFEEYGERMKATGAPVAVVTQDGMQAEDLPWNDIDALFIGGSTEWKTGQESAAIAHEAHRRGLWVHMGRVNGQSRFTAARTMGCDSVDGTFLAFAPDLNWPSLHRWLSEAESAPVMVL